MLAIINTRHLPVEIDPDVAVIIDISRVLYHTLPGLCDSDINTYNILSLCRL